MAPQIMVTGELCLKPALFFNTRKNTCNIQSHTTLTTAGPTDKTTTGTNQHPSESRQRHCTHWKMQAQFSGHEYLTR
uniref:Uncharacterized protein n=1 Tax=Arundo donax TaxID=35708 RepID=A0A0A9GEN5_ARUDO